MSSTQQAFTFRSHGGSRKGAGRPRGNRVSHASRPRFARPTPVHVTLRMGDHVWNLRSRRCFRRIEACFAASLGRFGLRLIEFSVQGSHLHLIVEADDSTALTRGVQGLMVRIARTLNALMKRTGKVFDDHCHAHLLRTPTELINAIRYVLQNAAHHFGSTGADPFSSQSLPAQARVTVLAPATCWLLREGWRRARRRPSIC
jgi:putative transposase